MAIGHINRVAASMAFYQKKFMYVLGVWPGQKRIDHYNNDNDDNNNGNDYSNDDDHDHNEVVARLGSTEIFFINYKM